MNIRLILLLCQYPVTGEVHFYILDKIREQLEEGLVSIPCNG